MPHIETFSPDIFLQRRNALVELIQKTHRLASKGVVMLFADFEKERAVFRQESSFYYLTGVKEPASALVIDLDAGTTVLYVPNFGSQRAQWMAEAIIPEKQSAQAFGVNEVKYLGKACKGYQCHPFFSKDEYADLLAVLATYVEQKRPIFTLNPKNGYEYIEQRFILQRIVDLIPGFKNALTDIAPLVAQLRRTKSKHEIELLYKAIEITGDAHYGLARELKAGVIEYELEGLLNYVFVGRGGTAAFPSIVASGSNTTVLHYHHNNKVLAEDELVVVDIGAEYNQYCADITRTYPVSGRFSDRQKEIYTAVLETQDYIANIAKPGYWLSNKEAPEKSLHHLAVQFLAKKDYDKFFTHGIGHFLGLDVHDVGDYKQPLAPGDVITIEPGIYIPKEALGVRIEDDYWVVEDGVVCLSEQLPKSIKDVEAMVQQKN